MRSQIFPRARKSWLRLCVIQAYLWIAVVAAALRWCRLVISTSLGKSLSVLSSASACVGDFCCVGMSHWLFITISVALLVAMSAVIAAHWRWTRLWGDWLFLHITRLEALFVVFVALNINEHYDIATTFDDLPPRMGRGLPLLGLAWEELASQHGRKLGLVQHGYI